MPRTIPDETILDAALEVMARQGYDGATTREIAAAAGINEVTLFRRFGSKKKLLLAAVEHEVDAFEAAGIDFTGDVEADLVRVVRFYRNLIANRSNVMALLLSEVPRRPELLDVMRGPLSVIARLQALIGRYQESGLLLAEPTQQALLALTGPLFMEGIVRSVEPDLLQAAVDPETHVRRFLHGRSRVNPGSNS